MMVNWGDLKDKHKLLVVKAINKGSVTVVDAQKLYSRPADASTALRHLVITGWLVMDKELPGRFKAGSLAVSSVPRGELVEIQMSLNHC